MYEVQFCLFSNIFTLLLSLLRGFHKMQNRFLWLKFYGELMERFVARWRTERLIDVFFEKRLSPHTIKQIWFIVANFYTCRLLTEMSANWKEIQLSNTVKLMHFNVSRWTRWIRRLTLMYFKCICNASCSLTHEMHFS